MKNVLLLAIMLMTVLFVGCGGDRQKASINSNNEPKYFSKLEISSVEYNDGKVLINGTTDLPTGSILSIHFDVAGRPDTEPSIGINQAAKVTDGRFVVEFSSPNDPEFKKGPYIVEVMFTPRSQSEDILKQVGNNGENLKGDNVQVVANFNIMEASKEVDIQIELGAGKPKYIEEAEELKIHLDFLKSSLDSIDKEYAKQKKSYNESRWASFVRDMRANLDEKRTVFEDKFVPAGKNTSRNYKNVVSIGEIYLKIHVNLLKAMWDDLDGSGGNPQVIRREINDILNSIDLP